MKKKLGMKVKCLYCGIEKHLHELVKAPGREFGRRRECKSCINARGRLYRKRPEVREKRKVHSYKSNRSSGKFAVAKHNALRAGKAWALTKTQYLNLTRHSCEYCEGMLPETGTGLDRLDNSKGYIYGNVVPCCTPCNKARHDFFTYDEMRFILGPAIKKIREARTPEQASAIKTCKRGHLLNQINAYKNPSTGWRYCRVCKRNREVIAV